MKQQTSFIIKNSNPKHKTMSYCFATLLLIVCWCFASTHKLYGQKNEFGLVYNFTGYNYDEMSDFGFRYARYINPRVSASFSFDNQKESATFKQLGNGVNVAAVWYVLKQISSTYNQILNETAPKVLKSIISAPDSPDEIINK